VSRLRARNAVCGPYLSVEACFGEQEIFQLELKDFAERKPFCNMRATMQIAKGARKPFQKRATLVSGEGHDHAARLSSRRLVLILVCRRAVAERRARVYLR